jgi:hypothetical protein
MSLAIYAAPFTENTNDKENNNLINQKRQHSKTQKRQPKNNSGINSDKVNSILETIHKTSNVGDDEDTNMGDFSPPPKPQSSGVDKTKDTENAMNDSNRRNREMFSVISNGPYPKEDGEIYQMNDYNNYGNKETHEEFYKKVMPMYGVGKQHNKQYYNTPVYHDEPSKIQDDSVLLKKLNYMIHLLEEQQDEKTNNITEEVVLYSFLGIFIIFVVDSFVRVGKYVR